MIMTTCLIGDDPAAWARRETLPGKICQVSKPIIASSAVKIKRRFKRRIFFSLFYTKAVCKLPTSCQILRFAQDDSVRSVRKQPVSYLPLAAEKYMQNITAQPALHHLQGILPGR